MKRSTLMRIALVVTALFMFSGVFAQVHDNNLVTGTPTNRDTITVNYQGIYIAEPDAFYHPNYNSGGGWALTAGFTWDWTYFQSDGTTPANAADYTEAAGSKANEIKVTWNTVGSYVLKSAEHAPAAYGGCADDTPSEIQVYVVDAPTRNSFPFFQSTLGLSNNGTYSYCGDQAGQDVTINLSGYPKFGVEWTLDTVRIDLSGAVVGSWDIIVDHSAGTGVQYVGTNNFGAPVTNQNYVLENRAFTSIVVNGKKVRTQYRYIFKGINDLYSRKSDYVLGSTSYFPSPASDMTFNIIVNPAPETGPIYHVPNNWGA